MGVVITGTLLTIFLNLRKKGDSEAEDYDVLGHEAQDNPFVKPIFPPDLKAFLKKPLSETFDQIWNGDTNAAGLTLLQTVAAGIPAKVYAATKKAGAEAYDVSVNLPPQGVLSASADNPTSARPGQVLLNYTIASCEVSFRTPIPVLTDPSWQLDVDAVVAISSPVPLLPCTLTPTAALTAQNPNIVPENDTAEIGEYLSILETSLGLPGFLDASAYGADLSQSLPLKKLSPLTDALAKASQPLQQLGFLLFSAEVVPNPNRLVLRITHPIDAAPKVWNAAVPQGPTLTTPPVLGLSRSQVPSGAATAVTVTGTHFGESQMNQLTIEWTDTTSGQLTESDIEYRVAATGSTPSGTITPKTLARSPGDNRNTFTKTGLVKNTKYEFRVRDADFLTYTHYSDWLAITTADTDTVDLYLSGNATAIGTAQLTTGAPSWSTNVTIPASTPPGVHTITAKVAGKVLATVSITVLAAGASPTPVLEVIDPQTQAVMSDPSTIPGGTFTLHGEGFPTGPVGITLPGFPAIAVLFCTADANGDFTQAVQCPQTDGFSLTVTATGVGPQMSVQLQVVQPPK